MGGWLESLSGVFVALAGVGIAYTVAATVLVRRFATDATKSPASAAPVTLLKPLHGAEPRLYENLVSFCDQDQAGPVQILFGVDDPRDPAVVEVERLIRERPARDIRLIVSAEPRGPNPKIANLVALEPHVRHDIVVVSDSDIAVGRDYLARTIAALEDPGVGLVTWLYRGVPQPGLWARLSSMAIDYHFFPGVLAGLKLGLARPAFGSTLALRRDTLESLGGFRTFLACLADDHAIGDAVRAAGMRVAIPDATVMHACPERTLGSLLRHELRWARTIRAVDPAGYAASAVSHALPLALVAAALGGFGPAGTAMLAAALVSRLVLALQVDHTLRTGSQRWWLGPLRDILSFLVFLASYFVGVVSWRDHRYEVRSDGTLAPLEKPTT